MAVDEGSFSALARSMWAPFLQIAKMPVQEGGDLEARIARIEEEAAVRRVLTEYTYAYDANMLEETMEVFHPDCYLVNPRGTYVGFEAIKVNYAYLMTDRKYSAHYSTNVDVRVMKNGTEAAMAAYLYGIKLTPKDELFATGGTYLDKLVKTGGRWKIIERRITANFSHPLPTGAKASRGIPPPAGTKAETSGDYIGPGVRM